MVTVPTASSSADAVPPPSVPHASAGRGPARWLIPGETCWEVWEQTPSGLGRLLQALAEGGEVRPLEVGLAALPATLVTCQLFWLETTDDKAMPDLIRMQCERRALLRNDEVFRHRIIRQEGGRSLTMVLILQNAIPAPVQGEIEARFEAHARCLALPPRVLAVWRSLGSLSLALTNEEGVVYFQSLPYRALQREALLDIRSILWLALAQNWISSVESFVLLGDWKDLNSNEAEQTIGLPVQRTEHGWLALPKSSMELVPQSVRHLRKVHRRQRRIKLGALALAGLYAVFLLVQIFNGVFISAANAKFQKRLDALMPGVLKMQDTARLLDALNPALDARTYPIEILYRATALLPEKGVRLTHFEITGNRLEIGGESSTAREAFDYIRNLEEAEALKHIEWEDAPQPIPLPNDTTRFSIRGTVQGAYQDEPENP